MTVSFKSDVDVDIKQELPPVKNNVLVIPWILNEIKYL